MKAGDERLGTVFNKDHRYVVPIFQRPYVWDEAENWVPLWDDLRKAAEDVERHADSGEEEEPQEYFLGALVTQHRRPAPRRTPTSVVIDGQQRMTTFQVFLAAACRVATAVGANHAADSLAALIRNRVSSDSSHHEDRYKLTPLEEDRAAFEWAVRRTGEHITPPPADHKLVRAAQWFELAVREWTTEASSMSDRLDTLYFAIENRIKVVSIYLDEKDDPQVIFEALNHRGVRLDAADLVKNLLFQTLEKQGDRDQEQHLHREYWGVLDGGSWREEVTTGRVKRVRVDMLLAYWLSAQRGEESSVEHLFEDFKRWLRTSEESASDVIKDLRLFADTMSRLQQLPMSLPVAQAINRLEASNTTTPWPLILYLHASRDVPTEQANVGTLAIDSFLMRRSVCRMTTKDYNRLFGSLLGAVKAGDPGAAGDVLTSELSGQTAPSRVWPDDQTFLSGLLSPSVYEDLARGGRLRTLLIALENRLITTRSEPTPPHPSTGRSFTVEHVLPVSWEKNWPLPSGAVEAGEERLAAVHSLGNLTLTTQSLNSTLSNAPWTDKRHTLQTHSLARLTTASILTFPAGATGWTQDGWAMAWDEERIETRGRWMAGMAIEVWPGPRGARPADQGADLWRVPTDGRSREEHMLPAGGQPSVTLPDSLPTPARQSVRTRVVREVTGDLLPLLSSGLIAPGDHLRHEKRRTGQTFGATVTSSGEIETSIGTFRAPSSALTKLMGSSRNGWKDWTHVETGLTLSELRDRLQGG